LVLVDCITSLCSTSGISVYLGKESGNFDFLKRFNVSRRMWQIAAGDFNGDGQLDLAASGSDIPCVGCAEDFADAIIFMGKGDGTFLTNVQFQTGSYPLSIALGDFNSDGKLDLITADNGAAKVSILEQLYTTQTIFRNERCAAQYGESVSFSAKVTAFRAGIIPTGTIAFSSNQVLLGTVPLNAQGSAALSTTQLPVGHNAIVGTYSGDSIFSAGSMGELGCVIGRTTVSVSVTSSKNPSQANQAVTFTATVNYWPGEIMPPTGLVTFSANKIVLGTAPLSGTQASFTTTFTKAGYDNIKAEYLGDGNYGAKGGFFHETVKK
jgi:Bacterial Ig-like domain (group 3)/FG-GAP-like repeat